MNQKNDCRCERTTCGCKNAEKQACRCEESCSCASQCTCSGGCQCATK